MKKEEKNIFATGEHNGNINLFNLDAPIKKFLIKDKDGWRSGLADVDDMAERMHYRPTLNKTEDELLAMYKEAIDETGED